MTTPTVPYGEFLAQKVAFGQRHGFDIGFAAAFFGLINEQRGTSLPDAFDRLAAIARRHLPPHDPTDETKEHPRG